MWLSPQFATDTFCPVPCPQPPEDLCAGGDGAALWVRLHGQPGLWGPLGSRSQGVTPLWHLAQGSAHLTLRV